MRLRIRWADLAAMLAFALVAFAAVLAFGGAW